jgi:glycosyltransferase involved in cell wall biosynthesis
MVFIGGRVIKKTVLLRGPVLTRSGYGEQARFAMRALRSREDLFDIYIHPLQWGHTGWLQESSEERVWMDNKIEKTISYVQNGGTFDISVQVTIPNEFEKLATTNIGYTAGIETTKCAMEWINQSNNLMDKVIFVSNHSKDTFCNTSFPMIVETETGQARLIQENDPLLGQPGYEPADLQCQIDTAAVNYPVKKYDDMKPLDLDLTTDYNFACVAQFGPRKNLQNTIKWFIEEFHDDSDVGLIIKTNVAKNCLIDREICEGRIKSMTHQHPDKKCKIYLLHGDMTDKEMHELYLNEKVFASLSLTHGEGFGLPLFEAAYMGVPVVAPGWSGQLDFLCDEKGRQNFYSVSYDLNAVPDEAVWDGVLIRDSMWAYPRENSAKEKMRECFNDAKSGNLEKYCNYANELMQRFEESKMYAEFVEVMGVEDSFDVESWLNELDIEEVE